MALRDVLRRAPEQDSAPPTPPVPPAVPAPPAPAAEWAPDPGFAAVALQERPADEPSAWAAAAEPIDVTDHTVEMPALAPVPAARRPWRPVLALTVLLACAGAALAASGVLRSKHDAPPAPVVGSASAIATAPRHKAAPKPARPARPARRRHVRQHRAARHHVAVAPAHVVAAVPVHSAPAPVRHVVSRPAPRPAPTPVATPRPAPRPVATKPTTTVSQPAPSAPSGEPGRQPPSTP